MSLQTPLLISVLIPTWNRVVPVLRAIESIGEIAPDMEVLVVDNASDLTCYEELKHHLGSLSGIKLFRNETNLGMVKNWNRCMELAQGEWLGLLCSDDQYQPGAIIRLRKILKTCGESVLIVQDPDSVAEIVSCPPGSDTVSNLALPNASGNFWHRQVYEQLGGFDVRLEYSADAEYWYRIAYSFPVVKVQEPFAVYMPHDNSYMWSTWRKPDFLQQIETLSRTVAGYIYAAKDNKEYLIEQKVDASLWETLQSIIARSFLVSGKSDIFMYYFPLALKKADSYYRKQQLIVIMLKTMAKTVLGRPR